MKPQELHALFKDGAPVRGIPVEVNLTTWGKVRLLFSKNFQLQYGGKMAKSTFYAKARAIFSKKFKLQKPGEIIGRGIYECDLVKMGFKKTELKKLCEKGLLSKVTTKEKSEWRKTYVYKGTWL